MSHRTELSFSAIVTLAHLCEMKLRVCPKCECPEIGFTCLHCRTKSAKDELNALVDQIGRDFSGGKEAS